MKGRFNLSTNRLVVPKFEHNITDFTKVKDWTLDMILGLSEDFVSLDISVTSTGWTRYKDNVLEWGTYTLEETKKDEVARRREYRQFLIGLLGDHKWPTVYIEDVIASVNHETSKVLIQLNPLLDDLVDGGRLFANSIRRENNGTWKRRLTALSGVHSAIKRAKNVKALVREQLHSLGFNKERSAIAEDVYDSLGMAVGTLYGDLIGDIVMVAAKKDLGKGYQLRQFSSIDAAFEYAAKKVLNCNGYIAAMDFEDSKKAVKTDFKATVSTMGDNFVFVLTVNGRRLGALGVDKGLDTSEGETYIVAYNEGIVKGIRKKVAQEQNA